MKNYTINQDDFEVQIIENEAIFQNKENGNVHFLNELAFQIYEMLRDEASVDNIINSIGEKYPDIDINVISDDCIKTISDFVENKIIIEEEN